MMRKVEELVETIAGIEKDDISCARALTELVYSLDPTKFIKVSEVLRDAISLGAAHRYDLVRELRSLFYIEGEEPLYSHETLGDGRDGSPSVYIYGDDGCVPLKTLNDEAASLFRLMYSGDGSCQDIQDLYDLALQDFLVFGDEFGFRP